MLASNNFSKGGLERIHQVFVARKKKSYFFALELLVACLFLILSYKIYTCQTYISITALKLLYGSEILGF